MLDRANTSLIAVKLILAGSNRLVEFSVTAEPFEAVPLAKLIVDWNTPMGPDSLAITKPLVEGS